MPRRKLIPQTLAGKLAVGVAIPTTLALLSLTATTLWRSVLGDILDRSASQHGELCAPLVSRVSRVETTLVAIGGTLTKISAKLDRTYTWITTENGKADRGGFHSGVHINTRSRAQQILLVDPIGKMVRITSGENGTTIITTITGSWPSDDRSHMVRLGTEVADTLGFPAGRVSMLVTVQPVE